MWDEELILDNPEGPHIGLTECDHVLDSWKRFVVAGDLRYCRIRPVNILADTIQSPAEYCIVRGQSNSFDVDWQGGRLCCESSRIDRLGNNRDQRGSWFVLAGVSVVGIGRSREDAAGSTIPNNSVRCTKTGILVRPAGCLNDGLELVNKCSASDFI